MILVRCLCVTLLMLSVVRGEEEEDIYSNSWAVEVAGGVEAARKIAEKHGFVHMGQVGYLQGVHHFIHSSSPAQSRQRLHTKHFDLLSEEEVVSVEQQRVKRRVKRGFTPPQDQEWPAQWYLHRPPNDMDIQEVWQQGVTGKGVVVSILDDGLEHTHPDLKDNYDHRASYDFNSHDPDPIPRYERFNENKHGTRCAGEVAAAKNDICGVGVAYKARIGGIRMLDGPVTDIVEANSLSLNPQFIDIYSSSWGPNDDGRTIDGPARLAKHAFQEGVRQGRDGKGSIFVWASGNGGRKDNCNCDGYAVSPYTISVGSASEHDRFPWYAEYCSSTLAATYSSGSSGDRQIVSTDLHGACTLHHTGTSASAPMAAGLLALALEVNPALTWRDAQYITVYSSNPSLPADGEWVTNGAGLRVSHRYGFGIMDAAALVNRARHWSTVPERLSCNVTAQLSPSYRTATHDREVKVDVEVTGEACGSIHYLEHVQAVTTLAIVSGRRGDVSLSLHSPHGTLSKLLQPRYLDGVQDIIKQWPFMTIQSWGEQPIGKWVFTVSVAGSTAARLDQLTLVLYGVAATPESVAAIPDKCHAECKGGCAKPGPRYCDSCKHYRLSSTLECVSSCPADTYQDLSVCRPCPPNCTHCTSSKCLSCLPDNILLPSGTCSYTCPPSTFWSASNTCTSCHPSCLTCRAAGASNCTKCASRQYRLSKGTCVLNTTCTSGSYFDHRAFECRPCHGSCAECRGSEAVDCTACYEGWLQVDGHCVRDVATQCGAGQYFSELLSNCTSCPIGCRNCSDDITCTQCQPGFFLQPRAVGETGEETLLCHTSCPTGYYPDSAQQQCRPCPPSCVSCTNPSSCLTCSEGGVPVNGTCSQPCAAGEYFNISMRQCLRCSSTCTSCKDGYSCTSCVGKLLLAEDGRCLSSCPQHAVADLTTGRCKTTPCHHSCATCRGPEPDDCLSCSVSRKLHHHTCLEQCPHDAYPANASCKPCHASCATCGGPLASDCDSCPHGSFLDHYHCLKECSAGAFPSDDGRCLSCLPNCVKCSDVRSCSGCKHGFIYSPTEHQCVTACPAGQYSNGGVCQRCPAPCTSCLSAHHCTGCSSGHALMPHQGSCLPCCTEHSSSPCCDCASSQSCTSIRTPSPSPSSSSSTLAGSSYSFSAGALAAGLLIAAAIVVVVVVAVVLVYKKRRGKQAPRYTALHQAHDGLSITADDHMDSESENEVYVKQSHESVPI